MEVSVCKRRFSTSCVVSFLFLWLMPHFSYGQEIDLYLLFRDWAISHNESNNDVIILRNARDVDFLNEEDRKAVYVFKIVKDSIIYTKPITKGFNGWCGNEVRGNLDREEWTLNHNKKELRYAIYLEESERPELPLYLAIYQIVSIGKKYLKLHLKDELYQGVE